MESIIEKEMRLLKLMSFDKATESGWEFLNFKAKGYDLPWKSLQEVFKIIPGEFTLVSGYTGQGKSELVAHIGIHAITQGAKLFISSLEMSRGQIHARIVRQATGVNNITRDYFDKVSQHFGSKIFIYDLCGTENVETILESCKFLSNAFGTDLFIFDNLMMLDKKTDDYNRQLETAQKLSRFSKEFKVSVILVAHSKKPQYISGQQKELSLPGIYDVLGGSGIGNIVDNHFSVTLNQTKIRALSKLKNGMDKNELIENEYRSLSQGDTILRRDKKREHGETFLRYLYYDKNFHCLKDYENEIINPIVKFSIFEEI